MIAVHVIIPEPPGLLGGVATYLRFTRFGALVFSTLNKCIVFFFFTYHTDVASFS